MYFQDTNYEHVHLNDFFQFPIVSLFSFINAPILSKTCSALNLKKGCPLLNSSLLHTIFKDEHYRSNLTKRLFSPNVLNFFKYSIVYINCSNPVGIYQLKVNNKSAKTRCEICSKLKIKTSERRH